MRPLEMTMLSERAGGSSPVGEARRGHGINAGKTAEGTDSEPGHQDLTELKVHLL